MTGHPLERYLPECGWYLPEFDAMGIHGVAHVARVLWWANRLAADVAAPGAIRLEELRWAAGLHDVGRIDDWIDRGHGSRSADWLLANLRRERQVPETVDLGFVAELCKSHELPDEQVPAMSLELLILKDADALDRARLGDLDPRKLRLARAHDHIRAAQTLERATNRYGSITGPEVVATAVRLFGSDRV